MVNTLFPYRLTIAFLRLDKGCTADFFLIIWDKAKYCKGKA